ncbi:MAG: hypothetical protein QM800_06070 [Paludibacter sp.]
MRRKITLLLFVALTAASTLWAQNLSISGVVVDKNYGRNINWSFSSSKRSKQ